MSSRSQARLVNYIREIDPELFAVMEKLAMAFSLQAGKNISGITFLRPVDDDVRQRIFKLAQSDKLEDLYQATYILNAAIITEYIPTHRDFHNRKGNIANRLGRKVDVGVVNQSRVEFVHGKGNGNGKANDNSNDNDTTPYAELDTNFVDSAKVPKYAAYTLHGELRIDSEKITKTVRKGRRARGTKSQQAADVNEYNMHIISNSMRERHYILASTAGEYLDAIIVKQKATAATTAATTPAPTPDPYLTKSLSLLMFVKQKYSELYPALLARTSLEKSDLFLYLQQSPNVAANVPINEKFLVPPDVLTAWNRGDIDLGGISVKDAVNTVLKDINEVLYDNEEHRISALESIDDERDELRDNLVDYNRVKGLYTTLIKFVPEKVLPTYTVEQKLWEDDFRMSCWAMFNEVEATAFDDGVNPISALEDMLDRLVRSMKGEWESRLMMIKGPYAIKDVPVFINSTYFMYIPVFDVLADLDLNPTDEVMARLEEDTILSGKEEGVEPLLKDMGDNILGSNLTATQVNSALDILLAKRRANTLSKEEEWKLAELRSS